MNRKTDSKPEEKKKKIPIEEWELAEEKLSGYFDQLIELTELAFRRLSGETIP